MRVDIRRFGIVVTGCVSGPVVALAMAAAAAAEPPNPVVPPAPAPAPAPGPHLPFRPRPEIRGHRPPRTPQGYLIWRAPTRCRRERRWIPPAREPKPRT